LDINSECPVCRTTCLPREVIQMQNFWMQYNKKNSIDRTKDNNAGKNKLISQVKEKNYSQYLLYELLPNLII
jgi:hypothetical protein